MPLSFERHATLFFLRLRPNLHFFQHVNRSQPICLIDIYFQLLLLVPSVPASGGERPPITTKRFVCQALARGRFADQFSRVPSLTCRRMKICTVGRPTDGGKVPLQAWRFPRDSSVGANPCALDRTGCTSIPRGLPLVRSPVVVGELIRASTTTA